MPNHVIHKVTCSDMDKLKKLLINEKGEVDFNIVLPRPTDLDITSGSHSYDTPSKYFFTEEAKRKLEKQRRIIGNVLELFYDEKITQAEFVQKVLEDKKLVKTIKTFKGWRSRRSKNVQYVMKKKELTEALENYIKGFFNIKRYKARDWYDWSIENWGTKWNAYDDVIDDDVIEFSTAWSTPLPVLVEVSKRLKNVEINVDYADEDIGSNCGTLEILNGEVNEFEPENPREFACNLWGYDESDFEDEEIEDDE